jgi:hypothetical protein
VTHFRATTTRSSNGSRRSSVQSQCESVQRFPRARLERLPKLLVTSGCANAAIDLDPAHELGILVAGTNGLARPTVELTWALILAVCPQRLRRRPKSSLERLAANDRAGARRAHAGNPRAGPARKPGRGDRAGFGDGRDRLEPEPAPGHAALLGVEAVSKEELFRRSERCHDPPQALRARPPFRRRARARGDEANRLPRQHLPRIAGRRARAARRATPWLDRGSGTRRLRH